MAPVTEAATTQPPTPRPADADVTAASVDVQKALDALASFGSVLSIKLYRLTIEHTPTVPVIPCLDHERRCCIKSSRPTPPRICERLVPASFTSWCSSPRNVGSKWIPSRPGRSARSTRTVVC
jgi:hypothetical protein